jgi:hypothetical protein
VHVIPQSPGPSLYQALLLVLRLGDGDVQQALQEFGFEPCSEGAHELGDRLGEVALKNFDKQRKKAGGVSRKAGEGSSSSASSSAPSGTKSSHKLRGSVQSKHHRKQPSFASVDVNGPAVNQMLVSAMCDNFVEPDDISYGSYNQTLLCEMTMRVREFVCGYPGAVIGVLASKAMDVYRYPEAAELMKHEVEMYEHLKDLQGKCIPEFGGIGRNPMYCFMYTLTVIEEGVPANKVAGGVTEPECDLIVAALRALHDRGVLYRHEDFGACVRVVRSEDNDATTRVLLTDLSTTCLVEDDQGDMEKAKDFELFETWRNEHFQKL